MKSILFLAHVLFSVTSATEKYIDRSLKKSKHKSPKLKKSKHKTPKAVKNKKKNLGAQKVNTVNQFDLKVCSSYENIWLNDLENSCKEGDGQVGCTCNDAESRITNGEIDCSKALCPDGCDVCELCLYYYTDCIFDQNQINTVEKGTEKESSEKKSSKKSKKSKKPKKPKKVKKTKSPTVTPTIIPTSEPTNSPTMMPTIIPTPEPTNSPTMMPTSFPPQKPSPRNTDSLTMMPDERLPLVETELFDLANCGSYEKTWLEDLGSSCSEDNRNDCQCKDAEFRIANGDIDCGKALCPEGCDVCELCLYYLTDCLFEVIETNVPESVTDTESDLTKSKKSKKSKSHKTKSKKDTKVKKSKQPKKDSKVKKSKQPKKDIKAKKSKQPKKDTKAKKSNKPKKDTKAKKSEKSKKSKKTKKTKSPSPMPTTIPTPRPSKEVITVSPTGNPSAEPVQPRKKSKGKTKKSKAPKHVKDKTAKKSKSKKPKKTKSPTNVPTNSLLQQPTYSIVEDVQIIEAINTPTNNFDLAVCSSYEKTWLDDLGSSCSEDNRNDCQCKDAEFRIANGDIDCGKALCPEGCDVCELCLYYLTDCLFEVIETNVPESVTDTESDLTKSKKSKKSKSHKTKSKKDTKVKKSKQPKKDTKVKKSKQPKKDIKAKKSKQPKKDTKVKKPEKSKKSKKSKKTKSPSPMPTTIPTPRPSKEVITVSPRGNPSTILPSPSTPTLQPTAKSNATPTLTPTLAPSSTPASASNSEPSVSTVDPIVNCSVEKGGAFGEVDAPGKVVVNFDYNLVVESSRIDSLSVFMKEISQILTANLIESLFPECSSKRRRLMERIRHLELINNIVGLFSNSDNDVAFDSCDSSLDIADFSCIVVRSGVAVFVSMEVDEQLNDQLMDQLFVEIESILSQHKGSSYSVQSVQLYSFTNSSPSYETSGPREENHDDTESSSTTTVTSSGLSPFDWGMISMASCVVILLGLLYQRSYRNTRRNHDDESFANYDFDKDMENSEITETRSRFASICTGSFEITSATDTNSTGGSDTRESDSLLEDIDLGGWAPFSSERFQESIKIAEDFGGWRPFSSKRLEQSFKNVGNLDEKEHDVTFDDDIEGWVPYSIKRLRESISSVLYERSNTLETATSMGESIADSSNEDMNNYDGDLSHFFTEGNNLGPISEEEEENFTDTSEVEIVDDVCT